jgi:DNA-binding transcriptional LysR family regulator
MIDAPALVGFVAIAETGSVHSAAKRLNISQAALSRRLQRLEKSLRVELFLRQGKRVVLSEAGTRLLPEARTHLDGLMTAMSAVSDDAQYGSPRVTFGCVPTVSRAILTEVVAGFVARRRSARVRAFDLSALEIPSLVAQRKVDFGVGMLGFNVADLSEQLIGEDPIVLAVRREHPFAAQRAIPWSMLSGQPLVATGAGSGVRGLLENVRNTIGVELNWQHEVQHLQTAIDWATAGIANAILPRLALSGQPLANLRIVRLTNPPISRRLGILTRPSEPLSRHADLLRRSIAAKLKEALSRPL